MLFFWTCVTEVIIKYFSLTRIRKSFIATIRSLSVRRMLDKIDISLNTLLFIISYVELSMFALIDSYEVIKLVLIMGLIWFHAIFGFLTVLFLFLFHKYITQEADLILGGDEGNECTYSKGYMKRQAIFSCLTCTPEGNAGVCTACSLSCHEGHEVMLGQLSFLFYTYDHYSPGCSFFNFSVSSEICVLLGLDAPQSPPTTHTHKNKSCFP